MALVDAIANVVTAIADGDLFYLGEDIGGGNYQDGQVAASVIKTYVLTGPLAVIGNASNGAEIRLPEDTDNGSNYLALRAPSALGSNLTFTLPSADGSSGHVLQTNGSGTLSFAAPSGGATAPLTLAGGTVVNPSTPLTITQTWNDAADTFDAFVVNVTNTASDAASRLLDLKVGGTSVLDVTREGKINLSGSGIIDNATDTNNVIIQAGGASMSLDVNAKLGGLTRLAFGSGSWFSADVGFTRAAANVLRFDDNNTNPTVMQYKPFVVSGLPSAATYSYGFAFVSDATATTIRSVVAGGGSNKVMVFSDGTNWLIAA